MKILKKMLSVILVVIMTLAMTIPVSATVEADVIDSVSLHFLSGDVPDDAIDYGRLYFSQFSVDELVDLGFTYEEILELRLAPAITAYEYDPCDDPYYYFPILSGDRVIAMLTMIDLGDGTYSVQFGKCKLAESLNTLNTNQNNPSILVISEDGMFALNKNNDFTLLDSYVIESRLSKSASLYCEEPNVTFESVALLCNNQTLISHETLYNDTVNYASPRLVLQGNLSVPFVSNGSNDRYPDGYCWAASLASIIKYRTGTSRSTTAILNELLTTGIDGYDYQIKELLAKYVDDSVTLSSGTGSMLVYTVKDCIDKGKPIYTDWQSFGEGGAHAMVVRGYYMNNELVGPGYNYGSVSIMDPNESTYQSFSLIPGQKYKIGVNSYEWYSSVY